MDNLAVFIDILLHLNQYLTQILAQYHQLTYLILAIIIFSETGLVIFPFLPGDSLLFAVGALAASTGELELAIIIPLLITAALIGDNLNYTIGKFFGQYIQTRQRFLGLKAEHIRQTESYYQRYGGRTIIIARFIPLIRSIAPFVAGTGYMNYAKFIVFCIIGAILWVSSLTLLGYQFGNLEIVKQHFEMVILGIIFISCLPIFYQAYQHRRNAN
ncbi:MAG: hypothetical protein RL637_1189 [Pseudomonadota bacterium]|jgi:membrane-associated protein